MKSVLFVLLMILIAGAGAAWHFAEAEIRGFMGWPAVEVVTKEDRSRKEPNRSKSSKTVEANSPAVKPSKTDDILARIEQIVTERYPEVKTAPFHEVFPNFEKLPSASFPDRVTLNQPASFKFILNGSLIAASYVKAGGEATPVKIEGDRLTVSSLADERMRTEVPVSDTDFETVVKRAYDEAVEDARIRIQKMRDEDRSDLKANSLLYRRLTGENTPVWEDVEDPGFDRLRKSLNLVLHRDSCKPIAWFHNGRIRVESETGRESINLAIVLIEGMDRGFGPFLWRARCSIGNGPLQWTGLPR